MSEKHIGEVVQVTGPVLDIRFPEGELPALLNAIEIDNHGEKLVVEVAQQDLSAERKQSTRAARSPFRSERSA